MLASDVWEHNPWWQDRKSIESDPVITSWKDSKLRWVPELMSEFTHNDHVYSLRGPRQVGKTTFLKLQIRELLKQGTPASSILYYSFELKDSPGDIVDVISEYLKHFKHDKRQRRFVYLDEITNVKKWEKAIKKLRDMGRLAHCTLILTGSHSADLRHTTELLPGRRGPPTNENLDKIFHPMKFRDFVSKTDNETHRKITDICGTLIEDAPSMIRQMLDGSISDDLWEAHMFQNNLDRSLGEYILIGGMPMVVDEFLKTRQIRNSVYQVYANAMMGDLRAMGKNTRYLSQLAPNILKSISTQTSWKSLTKDTDIGSHHTAAEYIQTLSDMFILSIFYRYNSATRMPKFDSLKKIYFRDPFFMHAMRSHVDQNDPYLQSVKFLERPENKGMVVEQAVADHCIRLAFQMRENKIGFNPEASAFYWNGKKTNEVDFVVKDGNSLVPIEVKYQNQIKRDDLYGMIGFQKSTGSGRGMIITKDMLKIDNVAVWIPAGLFLFLV